MRPGLGIRSGSSSTVPQELGAVAPPHRERKHDLVIGNSIYSEKEYNNLVCYVSRDVRA